MDRKEREKKRHKRDKRRYRGTWIGKKERRRDIREIREDIEAHG